ncbi:glycosyltransferase family 4 protein [Solirubrobacter ginsenosidimutans]|uniref:Glycosyltransferase family 4 protein n=1 Tax=Solirubrobacter ginsenosidimutans TaxID=490573 RepID=A0A9X3MYB1_9ACTN|nr:glycosyltransferase family 4 protein [Solirubrobacter ginsenosidimutans]MDA0163871.1 glycosyltransferase family 4 protein [Solirubrobacter ginsenosidimutans]
MDVTLVAHHIGPVGGMELQVAQLATGLLARGHRVTTIAQASELPEHELLTRLRVPVRRVPFALFYPWFAAAAAPLVARHARGIVHTAGAIVPNAVDVATIHFLHRAYAELHTAPRVSRDTAAHRLNARASRALSLTAERLAYRPARLRSVVAVSGGVRREVERWFPGVPATTIPHGVDLERFRPDAPRRAAERRRLGIAPDALVAVFVGGDWPRKGLTHAIRAVAAAARWQLLVIGRGDEAAFARVAAEAGAGERVHFLGVSRDTAAQYAAADAFVLPTRYETFSLVTYEAAASGLPLLVTRVSGPDELIVEGVNGAFIGDDAAVTARWLERLADPELRARLGAAARAAAAPYSWDAVVDRHVELYAELAAARNAARSAAGRSISQ